MLTTGQLLQKRYRIINLLGQGGMGAVYLVEDMRLLGRRCAIKEHAASRFASPQLLGQLRQQFQREAHTLAMLNHPNFPQVSDYFSERGNEYLVMDYIEGEDLQSVLNRQGGPLPEETVLDWALQILDALAYLHRQQPHPIIHRDIKPANLIVIPPPDLSRGTREQGGTEGGRAGTVKLVDFGLVKLLDASNPMTMTAMKGMGTPHYTPLEQYGGGTTDARADLYGLGATLYYLLTAVLPQVPPQRLIDPAQFVPPRAYNPALSPSVEAAIMKAMAIYPDQRFQTAHEMQAALMGQQAGVGAVAGGFETRQLPAHHAPTSGQSKASKASSSIPRWLWAVGGLLLFMMVALFGFWLGNGPSVPPNNGGEVLQEATSTPEVVVVPPDTFTPIISEGSTPTSTLPLPPATSTATAIPPPTIPLPLATSTATAIPPPTIPLPLATSTATAIPPTIPLPSAPSTATAIPSPTVTPIRSNPLPAPGETLVSEKDGMQLVLVMPGEFIMGSSPDDPNAYDNELPQHRVSVDAFWIDQTEVTNAMFARFTAETGYVTDAEKGGGGEVSWLYTNGADWRHPLAAQSNIEGLDLYPVTMVSWNDATAYCAWAGRRLPTEAEWEKAARGSYGSKYPWGNQDVTGQLANMGDINLDESWANSSINDGYQYTAPVGSYPAGASPYNAYDMAGNLWEWVADWYDESYYSTSPYENPQGAPVGEKRVLRGGSWYNGLKYMQPVARLEYQPEGRSLDFGFRCAQGLVIGD